MKKLMIVLSLLVCLFALPTMAELHLELTRGMSGAMPIAVVPFAAQNGTVQTNIAQIISTDLSNSGRFAVLAKSKINQFPDSLKSLNYGYWRDLKVNDVVFGKVASLAGNRSEVTFTLVNLYGNQSKQGVLLSQTYTVPNSQLLSLSHHLSDLIYYQLTGQRGVFSTKIAYVLSQKTAHGQHRFSLEVADIDGKNPTPLLVSPYPIMSPAWSPNGQYLAYVSFENKATAAIYIQNVITGQRTLLTHFPGINGAPAWSPDGKQLAMVLSTTGYPKIYLMNIASKKLTQLTKGWSLDTEPAFSPNGHDLLFTSNRGGNPQIYQLNLNSHKITRLTFKGNYNARGSYAPDGKAIVFLHRGENGKFNIAKQALSNGRMTVLTQSGLDESPSIAPNGDMIIYATNKAHHGVLAMVSADGRVQLRIPSPNGNVQEPAWSPYFSGDTT